MSGFKGVNDFNGANGLSGASRVVVAAVVAATFGLLAWADAAFAAGEAARPAPDASPLLKRGAWGNIEMPMVDATGHLGQ